MPATEKHMGRRIAIVLFVVALVGAFAVAGVVYGSENPHGRFLAVWNWYVALGLSLLATGGLSLLFYIVSAELPNDIKRQVHALIRQLQSPIKGYADVTNHIIEVCESAESHYYAATLMPLIGAVADDEFYQRYRQALVQKINKTGCCVELVFLTDDPLEQFMLHVIEHAEYGAKRIDGTERVGMVKDFIDNLLTSMMRTDEYKLLLKRTNFIPYQVCIADGAKAVLYFGQSLQMEKESSVRAFYTEDRAVIEVLNMGFESMKESATVVT